jgi:hypothetical protein
MGLNSIASRLPSGYVSQNGNAPVSSMPLNQAVDMTKSMAQQPWYVAQMKQWGLDPAALGTKTLSADQVSQLNALAKQNGVLTNDNFTVNEYGGVQPNNHMDVATKLGLLAVAGIATAGIASAFGGAAAGGGAADTAFTGPIAEGAAGAGGAAGTTAAGAGLADLVPAGSTFGMPAAAGAGSTALSGISTLGKAFSSLGQGNPATNAASANYADQLAKNRITETAQNQTGVAADKGSLSNMLRAGIVSRQDPNAPPLVLGGHVLPNLAPTAAGQSYAQQMQDQLLKRMQNGQPLTLSGTPPASPAEVAASNAAKNAAGIGTGLNSTLTKVGNTINQGVGLANLGQGIYNTGSNVMDWLGNL